MDLRLSSMIGVEQHEVDDTPAALSGVRAGDAPDDTLIEVQLHSCSRVLSGDDVWPRSSGHKVNNSFSRPEVKGSPPS